MSKLFQFKEFAIEQDKTAMKVGTDGVLLGAWCRADFPDTILDIGSGTGIISLMFAQRFDALLIDAVELNENAYQQTVENFEQSDWGDRLYCYHTNFEDFANEIMEEEETYDLIVSNPPFYTDAFETENKARNAARFTSSLSFENLISNTSKILSENGKFAVIIPFKEKDKFALLATRHNLFLNRVCNVKGNPTSNFKRSMMEFSFHPTAVIKEELTIEIERHQYTDDYIKLTKDFYLYM